MSVRSSILLPAALIAVLAVPSLAGGVDDPVAAAEAAWEEDMRQLAEEGDGEAAVELGRIAAERGDTAGAREWLRRAEALGAEVPADLEQTARSAVRASGSGGGWGSGSVERRAVERPADARRSVDPCSRPGIDLDMALRRADLALANRDLDRWIQTIVPVVRAGCRSPALVDRIEMARNTEESLEADRDREVADAVRRGRPTVGTQVGEPLNQGSSGAGAWAEVAGALIGIMESRRDARPTYERRIPEGADQATRNAYAGIWADTQDQIERDPEGNEWDRVNELIKRAPTVRGQVDAPPAPADSAAAGAVGGGLATPSVGGDLSGGDCQPAPASECEKAVGPGEGECVCCNVLFGLPHCGWQGDSASSPSSPAAGGSGSPSCVFTASIQQDLKRLERGERLPGPPGTGSQSDLHTWWVYQTQNSEGQTVYGLVRDDAGSGLRGKPMFDWAEPLIISPAFPQQPWEAWEFLQSRAVGCGD